MGFYLPQLYESSPPKTHTHPNSKPSQKEPQGSSPGEQEHAHPGGFEHEMGSRTGGSSAGARRKIEPLKPAKHEMPERPSLSQLLAIETSPPWGWHQQTGFFVTRHSALALIMQHNRNFSFWRINHIAWHGGSIGTAGTMWWELSTPSLKSTRCII